MTQHFKTVYLPSAEPNERGQSLTLAFAPSDSDLYRAVEPLSSLEVRGLLGHANVESLYAAAKQERLPVNTYCVREIAGKLPGFLNTKQLTFPGMEVDATIVDPIQATFKGGRDLPMHSWFPYLEGYSPDFVTTLLETFAPEATRVLDPFAGTGTTPLTCAMLGKSAFYCELNPVLQTVMEGKIVALLLSHDTRVATSERLLRLADSFVTRVEHRSPDVALQIAYDAVFGESVYFERENLDQILKARRLLDEVIVEDRVAGLFLSIATMASLVPASKLIRRGDLRFRKGKEIQTPGVRYADEVSKRIREIANDLLVVEQTGVRPCLLTEDARALDKPQSIHAQAVVTSPPYLNGTNYYRNTKLELWFIRRLVERSNLDFLRQKTVTSGIVEVTRLDNSPTDTFVSAELSNRIAESSYDRRIPQMVEAYFSDMAQVTNAMASQLAKGARVIVDIGDSAYAGVHVPTHEILKRIMESQGFEFDQEHVLRKRLSRGGLPLRQTVLVFRFDGRAGGRRIIGTAWKGDLNSFQEDLPHQQAPFSKRNWGHPLHSLCSYQGKMKPAIAHHLVKIFLKPGDRILDPFGGVGTIPFEAALHGAEAWSFDISPAAFQISKAKLSLADASECRKVTARLAGYLSANKPSDAERASASQISFNKALESYFNARTFDEVLLARRFFLEDPPKSPSESLVFSCLLHILHGNRPYALSRRSHPITPFAPGGPSEYRPLMPRLEKKLARSLGLGYPKGFKPGHSLLQDATSWWPDEVTGLDAIITSPPFFDSTRFYLANWMRLWFCGWEAKDFKTEPQCYIDELQKKSFRFYEPVFRQARERLREDGVLLMHLGKSHKCDMADELAQVAEPWFQVRDIVGEGVDHCESHGIRDKGTVAEHSYLVLQ